MTDAEYDRRMTAATRIAKAMVEAIPEDTPSFEVAVGALIASAGLCIIHRIHVDQAVELFRNIPLWQRADELLKEE